MSQMGVNKFDGRPATSFANNSCCSFINCSTISNSNESLNFSKRSNLLDELLKLAMVLVVTIVTG